jgi:uncharacterized protein YndB with AHSA1/START domain
MLEDMIEREVLIEASREKVWQALTDRVNLGAYRAVVKRAEQPDLLSYRRARDTDAEPAEGNSTLVEFNLTEVFAGTLLRVVETGFASLHTTEAEQAKAVQDNTGRWQSELAELKEYAEEPAG